MCARAICCHFLSALVLDYQRKFAEKIVNHSSDTLSSRAKQRVSAVVRGIRKGTVQGPVKVLPCLLNSVYMYPHFGPILDIVVIAALLEKQRKLLPFSVSQYLAQTS